MAHLGRILRTRTSRVRAWARASIAISCILVLPVVYPNLAFPQGSDTTPPELVDFSFSPTTVDVTTGPVTVDVSIHVTDDLSGFQKAFLWFESPSGQQGVSEAIFPPPIAGDLLDGVFEGQLTVPQFAEQGAWKPELRLFDALDNDVYFFSSDLNALGFPTELIVGPQESLVNDLICPKAKHANFDLATNIFSFDLRIVNCSDTPIIDAPLRIEIESLTPAPPTILVNNPDGGGNGIGAYWDYSDNIGGDNSLTPGEKSEYVRWEFLDESRVDFYFWANVYGVLTKTGAPIRFKMAASPSTGKVEVLSADRDADNVEAPEGFQLLASYPNPFSSTRSGHVRIPFSLPENVRVKLEVYNLLGQRVRVLANAPMTAGYRTLTWDGMDPQGAMVPGGIFLIRMTAGREVQTRKLLLLR